MAGVALRLVQEEPQILSSPNLRQGRRVCGVARPVSPQSNLTQGAPGGAIAAKAKLAR